MTHREILEKSIRKAIDNGFRYRGYKQFKVYVPDLNWIEFNDLPLATHVSLEPYSLIFNHDFAKALWGEHTETMIVQNNTLNVKQVIDMDGWRYHLQQMVIAEDPIKYLGYNL